MRPRHIALALAAVAVAAVFALGSGDDPYSVDMRLANAGGLRDGSPVIVGGVRIGAVELDADRDGVDVSLRIDDEHAPLGEDATAAIVAQNVLGQKQVQVTGPSDGAPAPDGFDIPQEQIRESTDLDQLLSALDADTRTRLAVLLNETGTALAGRTMDLRRLLVDLAPALQSGDDLVGELARDNRALGELIDVSDRYVAELADERKRIGRMFDRLGEATETVAATREELQETLRSAPAGLRSARGFLAELRRTAQPLRRTAELITQTAPHLRTALHRLEPFRAVAAPLLDVAVEQGPELLALDEESTATAREAVSTVGEANRIARTDVPPVGRTLDKSMNNLLATVDNWAHAIQFRDGLGRVFRGEASVSPQLYERILKKLGAFPTATKKPRTPRRSDEEKSRKAPAPATKTPGKSDEVSAPPRPKLLPERLVPDLAEALDTTVDEVLGTTDGLLDKALGGVLPSEGKQAPPGTDSGLTGMLDYLLGDG